MNISLVLNFKKRKKPVRVAFPSTWGDLTLGQAIALAGVDFNQPAAKVNILSIITGLSVDEARSFKDLELAERILSLFSAIPDISNFRVPDKIAISGVEYKIPKDLRQEAFGQKAAIEELLKNAQADQAGEINLISLMPYALAVYFYPMITGEQFDDDRISDYEELMKTIPVKYALPVAGFFFEQIRGIIEQERLTLAKCPSPEQQRAGIRNFDQYGILNTIDALADGDVLRWKDVMRLRYEMVYMKLRINKTLNEYQERYAEIIRTK